MGHKMIKAHTRCVRRLHRSYNIGKTIRTCQTRQSQQKILWSKRNSQMTHREKFGIQVPQKTQLALLLDKENGNNKWGDTTAKEMEGMKRLDIFKFHSPTKKCPKTKGWQSASMHMSFNIKQQDL